jgi:hypothetical protein
MMKRELINRRKYAFFFSLLTSPVKTVKLQEEIRMTHPVKNNIDERKINQV